jgi:hypothetical protein
MRWRNLVVVIVKTKDDRDHRTLEHPEKPNSSI